MGKTPQRLTAPARAFVHPCNIRVSAILAYVPVWARGFSRKDRPWPATLVEVDTALEEIRPDPSFCPLLTLVDVVATLVGPLTLQIFAVASAISNLAHNSPLMPHCLKLLYRTHRPKHRITRKKEARKDF
jgi:hypothetical protein